MARAAQGDRAKRDARSNHSKQQSFGMGQFGVIQALAPSLGVEITSITVLDAEELKRGIAAFVRGLNNGLVVTTSGAAQRQSAGFSRRG
jgi:hypothetical protein